MERAGPFEKLFEFATALGAKPRLLSAREHDHLLAYISHLPQLVSSALMHLVGDAVGRDGLGLTGRGLQDVTRLASSPAGIWKDVCASNADELGPALDALIKILAELRADLSASSTIDTIFQSANYWRKELHKE